ncbi:MAG: triose-phosphate isomerase [Desulfuromonadia bacterium]
MTSRRPIIAGNWKLYKTTAETAVFIDRFLPLIEGVSEVEIVIAPVFTALSTAASLLKGSPVHLAAQDCFWEPEGAFTGEVSPRLLADVGCSHVIIGHSERRQYFGETDESVNRKVRSAIAAGLVAILCIGETLEEREADKTLAVLDRQLTGALTGIEPPSFSRIVIAYEPVWAIGTGKTATNDQAEEAHRFIRSTVATLAGDGVASSVRILYGGSVKPENIAGLMAQPDIDGALVGGASLKPDSFASIVRFGV